MITKNHKKNTNFQIVYFLIGSCSTPDGAYSLLCDLKEERQSSINAYKVTQLKDKAKEIRANKLLKGDEADKLEGEAELLELKNNKKQGEELYKSAVSELEFIDKCIEELQPLRKYADLPEMEAHEASQLGEWRGELLRRAENYMITTGGIPPDHFDTMRMHPEFNSVILPRINEMKKLMLTKGGLGELQKQLEVKPLDNLVKLLK